TEIQDSQGHSKMSQRNTRSSQDKQGISTSSEGKTTWCRNKKIRTVTEIFQFELENNIQSSLPLKAYMAAAYEHQDNVLVDGWKTPLWEFTRLVKAHPSLRSLSGDEALAQVEAVLETWSRPDEEHDVWAFWFADSGNSEDAGMEFLHIWDAIRYLPGLTPLQNAIEMAKTWSFVPSVCPTEGYRRFVTLAGCLQEVMGDRNILLPCHKLAKVLGCEPITISRYCKLAIAAGILRVMAPHTFSSKAGNGTAREFRFDCSKAPCEPAGS